MKKVLRNGATITGATHGVPAVLNLSSIDVSPDSALATIGDNADDLFCDSTS